MRNLARKTQVEREVTHDLGTVTQLDGAWFVVETDARELRALRATSCLLEPAPGDLVLVASVGRERGYVLAVLEREAGAPGTIVADGDLDIQVRRGAFGVAAQEGVSVVSSKRVSIVSGAVGIHAVDGDVAFERLSFVGKLFRAEVAKAKLFAESFDAVLDRWWQRVKRSYRIVESCDHLRAGQIDYAATKSASLHGANTLVTAENLAKVEADQIHLG